MADDPLHTESAAPRHARPRSRGPLLAGLLLTAGLIAGLWWQVADTLAQQAVLSGVWALQGKHQVVLQESTDPALAPLLHQPLDRHGFGGVDAPVIASLRWTPESSVAAGQIDAHQRLAQVLNEPRVTLRSNAGVTVNAIPHPRGWAHLGHLFWMLCAIAATATLIGVGIMLLRPDTRNALFVAMVSCQSINLLGAAIESALPLGVPNPWAAIDAPLRLLADLLTAATIVHVACLHPRRLPDANRRAKQVWLATLPVAALLLLLGARGVGWWIGQAGTVVLSLVALALLTWPYRDKPHPFASALHQVGSVILVGWVALSLLAAWPATSINHDLAVSISSRLWYLLMIGMLLLAPAISRSQVMLRELGLIAILCTLVTACTLLFVTLLGLSQHLSLGLSLLLSLTLYAGVRQWIQNRILRRNALTTERMFEQLYRIAREIEQQPEALPERVRQLLSELFDVRESFWQQDNNPMARALPGGSTLIVPLADDNAGDGNRNNNTNNGNAVVLRYAQRGQRLFSEEDALLASRIVDQLQRAVGFDRAVERGRFEERTRMAQDLHDDIGARLLTMIYKASTPEIADYARHTLQDLKTLTRGLSAKDHLLSHACAEWKADLTQRLQAAHIELACDFTLSGDVMLNVVQWSALTRILRELVTNVMTHAQANRVSLHLSLSQDQRLQLRVSDNGKAGGDPSQWSHGLGLGGVRKRVRQLNGTVQWTRLPEGGICCEVSMPGFGTPH
jgi:signal transduction histidine kinase